MSEGFEGGGQILLQNPVSDHFPSFIVGNSVEGGRAYPPVDRPYLYLPPVDESGDRILLPYCDRVVKAGECEGKTLVICGAGPSLRETAAEWCPKGDDVWGCNSALTWLYENGHKVTHGYTIDQTAHMLGEWHTAPDVKYILASTVHPNLTSYLLSRDRDVTFFHNFVGIKQSPVKWPDENGIMREETWEDWAYQIMYSGTVRAGSGLNAVTRAIDVALFMGYEKIIVLGADCCLRFKKNPPKDKGPGTKEFHDWLRNETVMHADGGHALASEATPVVLTGEVDGRLFAVKPDLVITAVWLVVMRRKLKGRLEIIGDGLPNALKHKSNKFLERLPQLVDSEGNSVPISVPDFEEAA
jgi:hypothetical protein